MRCCLINPLYGLHPSINYSPPLGLAYIASFLEKNGHDVIIIDRACLKYKNGEINLKELDSKTEREILSFEPHLIGIGAMTIQIYDTKHVAKLIRGLPSGNDYPIIVGGFHLSAEPELTLRECPEVDIVCRGEGELTMLQLASGEKKENIGGLTFRKNGEIYSTESKTPVSDLDILPIPARHLLDMDFYCRRNDMVIPNVLLRATTMITSRGCPFDCKFCSNKLIYKSVRFHSLRYTIDEINYVVGNYRIDAISFVDTMFLSGRRRIETLCQELIDTKLNKKFKWACSARADVVDENILRLMKKAGCIYINYGFESGSQRMLDLMNKKTTVNQNYRAATLTNKAGILVNSALITNLPKETEDDTLSTIDFLKNARIYCASLNNLLPLPGSPYYRELLDNGTLTYSDRLWEEVGALQSLEKIRIYSDIPRDRFVELCNEANRIIAHNNMKNYIRLNWRRHPIDILRKVTIFTNSPLMRFLGSIYQILKRIRKGPGAI